MRSQRVVITDHRHHEKFNNNENLSDIARITKMTWKWANAIGKLAPRTWRKISTSLPFVKNVMPVNPRKKDMPVKTILLDIVNVDTLFFLSQNFK